MKYKKYLVFILIMMIFSINTAYAETCYYQSSSVSVTYDTGSNKFSIKQRNANTDIAADQEPLINRGKDFTDKGTGITISAVPSHTCPTYIVYRRKSRALFWDSDGIYGFDNQAKASEFASASSQLGSMSVWQAGYTNSDGSKITEAQFNQNMKSNVNSIINASYSIDLGGSDSNVTCGEIFGSKSDPKSISYLVNEILKYPRYIVPVLIILLGTIDFFKAVMAGKEDDIKKAQMAFVKRVIAGVAVFLVPVLIDAIMYLADIVWEGLGYTSCNI